MEGSVTITLNEILEAIATGMMPEDADAITTEEIAERTGVSVDTVRRRLIKPYLRAGQLEPVRKRVIDSGGRVQPVVAYRLRRP